MFHLGKTWSWQKPWLKLFCFRSHRPQKVSYAHLRPAQGPSLLGAERFAGKSPQEGIESKASQDSLVRVSGVHGMRTRGKG